MPELRLVVVSLRYSSWSIRPWLALTEAGIDFRTETVEPELNPQRAGAGVISIEATREELAKRREMGSVNGLFPVLWIDDEPVHEALAICEWAAEQKPAAGLWPKDSYARALARSYASEMATGFPNLRSKMSCHVFGRVPNFEPDLATRLEVERVFHIWRDCLALNGGPFLNGASLGIVDAMYFPVLTRFRTYGVELPDDLAAYAERIEASPTVRAWHELAVVAPALPHYDAALEALGGDPRAAIPS